MVNPFDFAIMRFINGFLRHSKLLDETMVFLQHTLLFSGAIPIASFWYVWHRCSNDQTNEKRQYLLSGMVCCVIAVFLARLISFMVPFRMRPLAEPALNYQVPYGGQNLRATMIAWNSFPSDHAALLFCLAVGIWLVSRPVGTFIMTYIVLCGFLPLIYIGQHYPTDIIAGSMIGGGVALLQKIPAFRVGLARPAIKWMNKETGSFYAFLFLCTFEIAELFGSLTGIVVNGLKALHLIH
jgi:membrane-associated phospholipid phosphatase